MAYDLISLFVCIRCNHKPSFEAERANFFPSKAIIIMFKWFKKKIQDWLELKIHLQHINQKLDLTFCFRRTCVYTCIHYLHIHGREKRWDFHLTSGINAYCVTYKSTFLLVFGLGNLEVSTEKVTCIFLPLMMKSEVRVKVAILLLSVLISCTANTGVFFPHPPLFHDYHEHSYSGSSNGEVLYKWT